MSEFSGKTVLICGGTSGIGLDCAKKFCSYGASVTCLGKTDRHVEQAKRYLQEYDRCDVRQIDLTSHEAVLEFFDEYKTKASCIDILINSAGTISAGGIGVETVFDWDKVVSANLRSVFLSVSNALPLLKKSEYPSIINVSSVCSIRPCTSLSYSVSKAGIDMMSKCLAKDLAEFKIRVNSVNPGVVESNLQKSAGLFDNDNSYSSWVEDMKKFHPLGRVGMPDDVSSAIEFLASSKSSWVTGAILSVDGGRAIA